MAWIKKYTLRAFLMIGIIAFSVSLSGQMKKDLENRRKKLVQDIKETQALLKSIQKNKSSTLDEYQTIKAEVDKRTELINTIKKEIEDSELQITSTQDSITILKSNLTRYKGDYANMMRHAYRHRNANKRLLFILSAAGFNDAMRRWQYFVRYDFQRKKQITLVGETQNKLNQNIVGLQKTKENKETLLVENEEQQTELTKTLDKQEKLLKQLKSKEASTKADLATKNIAKERLTDAIDEAIRMSMKRSAINARNREKGVSTKMTKTQKQLSKAFKKAKGKLPMPVKGVITGKYGTHKHPTLKKVTVKNNGIDIKTYRNSKVKAIFGGIVTNVFSIPGSQNAVMVRHGNYFTVYSNLSRVLVKKGQKINQSETIAQVATSTKTNQPELHLEIWQDSKRLNPQRWLKR
ncbi:MAG: murein hydrolase activator EnvC family protein [Saprospiraceae bacterium]